MSPRADRQRRRRAGRFRLVGAGLALLAAFGGAPAKGGVDLLSQANVRIDGAAPLDRAGWSVAGAGDVNGDGRDDVLLGVYAAAYGGLQYAGAAYVVFGREEAATIDLASLAEGQGFVIGGTPSFSWLGYSVAGAGDVNGDGKDDVVVGAPWFDPRAGRDAGAAWVVYGKAGGDPVDLASLTQERGFRIEGAGEGDHAGQSVAGAGDVNGDGRDDVVVGAYWADPEGRADAGSAYVVFGRARAPTVELGLLGGALGFRVDGAAAGDRAGAAVAGAGDVNGDGMADVLVGAYLADPEGRTDAGSAYVVFAVPAA